MYVLSLNFLLKGRSFSLLNLVIRNWLTAPPLLQVLLKTFLYRFYFSLILTYCHFLFTVPFTLIFLISYRVHDYCSLSYFVSITFNFQKNFYYLYFLFLYTQVPLVYFLFPSSSGPAIPALLKFHYLCLNLRYFLLLLHWLLHIFQEFLLTFSLFIFLSLSKKL